MDAPCSHLYPSPLTWHLQGACLQDATAALGSKVKVGSRPRTVLRQLAERAQQGRGGLGGAAGGVGAQERKECSRVPAWSTRTSQVHIYSCLSDPNISFSVEGGLAEGEGPSYNSVQSFKNA